jgi:phage N-6-adenine-methyltransferase
MLTDLTEQNQTENLLPAMLESASQRLAMAKSSGEVLEARDMAQVAYDMAKSAARIAKKKKAHDEIIALAYRMQGDALAIQSRAKIRLADEYDAAQERGEVSGPKTGRPKSVEDDNAFIETTAADLGLRRDEIYEARQMRDAENESPGIIQSVIEERIAAGVEPTKAAISAAVEAVSKPHVSHSSGNNEWYTPSDIIEAARSVLGGFDLDPASSDLANKTVKAGMFFTSSDDGLEQDWPIGRIWMNPPYAQPLMGLFADRFAAEIQKGSSGIVLVNNATETAWFQTIAADCTAICFPRSRVRFIAPDGTLGAPLQGQAIIYCGDEPSFFQEVFGKFGLVLFHG